MAKFIAPWRGDLDGIVSRRYLRILVTFSRTNYFLDKGEQRGATYEAARAFETFLNKELKTGSLPCQWRSSLSAMTRCSRHSWMARVTWRQRT